jgi:hypothetical protein
MCDSGQIKPFLHLCLPTPKIWSTLTTRCWARDCGNFACQILLASCHQNIWACLQTGVPKFMTNPAKIRVLMERHSCTTTLHQLWTRLRAIWGSIIQSRDATYWPVCWHLQWWRICHWTLAQQCLGITKHVEQFGGVENVLVCWHLQARGWLDEKTAIGRVWHMLYFLFLQCLWKWSKQLTVQT